MPGIEREGLGKKLTVYHRIIRELWINLLKQKSKQEEKRNVSR